MRIYVQHQESIFVEKIDKENKGGKLFRSK